MRRTPAFGFAWSIWTQHRAGLIGSILIVTLAALLYPALFAWERVAGVVIAGLVPMIGVFAFVMNAFLFTDQVGNALSGYPRRMFALPVRTATLAAWPLLFSMAAGACVCLAITGLVYRRSGFDVPLMASGLGGAALMAVLQAIAWAPIERPWVRMVVTNVSFTFLFTGVIGLAAFELITGPMLVVVLAGLIVGAAVLALLGVGSARHGDGWRLGLGEVDGNVVSEGQVRARRPSRSVAEAQRWYEWRCHGWLLPADVACVLGLLVVGAVLMHALGTSNARSTVGLLVVAVTMPLLLAGTHSAALGRLIPMWEKSNHPIAFLATRPMTSGALAAAKFRMAAVSLGWTWLIVGFALALLLIVSGVDAEWIETLRSMPMGRVTALSLLALGGLMVLSFKQMTDLLPASLTGRRWVTETLMVAMGVFIGGGTLVGVWIPSQPALAAQLRGAAPWGLGVAFGIKLAIAAAALGWAWRQRLLSAAALGWIVLGWATMALGLLGLALWSTAGIERPLSVWALVCLFGWLAPLGRFGLATLALDWNRHR